MATALARRRSRLGKTAFTRFGDRSSIRRGSWSRATPPCAPRGRIPSSTLGNLFRRSSRDDDRSSAPCPRRAIARRRRARLNRATAGVVPQRRGRGRRPARSRDAGFGPRDSGLSGRAARLHPGIGGIPGGATLRSRRSQRADAAARVAAYSDQRQCADSRTPRRRRRHSARGSTAHSRGRASRPLRRGVSRAQASGCAPR
jgi:hypothetical protein